MEIRKQVIYQVGESLELPVDYSSVNCISMISKKYEWWLIDTNWRAWNFQQILQRSLNDSNKISTIIKCKQMIMEKFLKTYHWKYSYDGKHLQINEMWAY